MSKSNISGKVVVVTGASSGIGESTARLLADKGARLVLGARRKDRIDAIVKEILAKDGKAVGFATDVARRADVDALIAGGLKAFGHIDVLVNNAGVMPLSPMSLLKVDEWERTIDINVKGVLYGIAAVLPQMRKQKSGQIINISSIAGFKVFAPGGTVYSATKFAVRAITEGLRIELKADHLRLTTISPGAVESELMEGTSDEATAKGLKEFYKMAIPTASVARAIAYAIEQPADVEIGEIVIRPTMQEF